MTNGPYKKGKNRLSAQRMNETDALARMPFHVGPGLKWDQAGGGRRLSLVKQKTPKPATSGGGGEVRLGYILALVPTAVEMLMMQFLDYTIQTFTDAQGQEITRVLWAPDGGPHLAFVAPNMRAADVRLLVPVALNAGTPIFRCDKIKDMWFATFLPRWAIRAKPDGITIVRCQ